MPSQVAELLRFRGELVAAGVVVLATGVLLTLGRFEDQWSSTVRLVVVALCAALVLGLAWLAPQEDVAPRVYASVLLVAGFPLAFVSLSLLAQTLGADGPSAAGTITWTGAVLSAGYATLARRRRSAICTLLAGATGVVTLVAFVTWVFDPDGLAIYRWLLLACILALGTGALRLRDTERRHAVSLIDVVGLGALGLAALNAVSLIGADLLVGFGEGGGSSRSAGTGWEIVLLLVGCGLVAYAAVDREPGPGYLGAFVLLAFVLTAAGGGSLVGWPIILVLIGGAALVAGLRPTTPAPPPPDAGSPPAPTVSMPPPGTFNQ